MAAVLVGLIGLIGFSLKSPGETENDPIWGREAGPVGGITALRVLTEQAEQSTLDREVVGRTEILVISPACPACVVHLVNETSGLERAPSRVREAWKRRLLLVARDQGAPSEELRQALARAVEAGAKIVYATTPDIFFELDIRRVPALLRLQGGEWLLDPSVR